MGVPLCSGCRGGRNEADVLGVRLTDDNLEIFHIEVGTLSGKPADNAEMIRKKFSQQNIDSIKEYCRLKLNHPQNKIKYDYLYAAVWVSDRSMEHLKQQKLPVKPLWDLIDKEMINTIKEWKKNPPHRPQVKGKSVTLPEGMWLVYLMDYILN